MWAHFYLAIRSLRKTPTFPCLLPCIFPSPFPFPSSYKGLHWLLCPKDWHTVGLQSQVSMVSALSSFGWRRQTYTGTSKYRRCWSCCQYEVPREFRRGNTLFSGCMGSFPWGESIDTASPERWVRWRWEDSGNRHSHGGECHLGRGAGTPRGLWWMGHQWYVLFLVLWHVMKYWSVWYVPLPHSILLGSDFELCWAWEWIMAQSCPRRWPGRYGGAI